MYSNVPTGDLIHIIDFICDQQGTDGRIKYELTNISKTIIEQNYFQFENSFYSQESGLAMGSPTSSIFSEVYRQYVENTAVCDIVTRNNITGYFRYVDDILIVYNRTTTDILKVFDSFNQLMPTMRFTTEKETDNRINFLDTTIAKEHNKLTFDIFRTPTTTDSIIPYDSRHPMEHKIAAIRYLTNRMNTYHLNAANKEKERNIIKHILQKNKYDISTMKVLPKTQVNKVQNGSKWAKFTCIGKETKFITKRFKNSPVNISYTTHNTISKLLSQQSAPKQNKFDGSGVYQLTCPDFRMKGIGQTGRSFCTRFSEHFRDYKYANYKSNSLSIC
jgi:hypothetical protein